MQVFVAKILDGVEFIKILKICDSRVE